MPFRKAKYLTFPSTVLYYVSRLATDFFSPPVDISESRHGTVVFIEEGILMIQFEPEKQQFCLISSLEFPGKK
jgi:hypothetical protein